MVSRELTAVNNLKLVTFESWYSPKINKYCQKDSVFITNQNFLHPLPSRGTNGIEDIQIDLFKAFGNSFTYVELTLWRRTSFTYTCVKKRNEIN